MVFRITSCVQEWLPLEKGYVMKKFLFPLWSAAVSLCVSGCGGDMVGENTPNYSVPPLMSENTQKITLSGRVVCQDASEKEVVLTITNIDKRTGNAIFTVSFAGDEVRQNASGTFREINNKSVVISSSSFDVTYLKAAGNERITNKFVFAEEGDVTTLVYSGDPHWRRCH